MSAANVNYGDDNVQNGEEIAASGSDGVAQPITRVSRACEPCRVRKTKCDIATKAICSECAKRKKESECVLREKARPSRLPAAAPARRSSKRPRSSSPQPTTQAVFPSDTQSVPHTAVRPLSKTLSQSSPGSAQQSKTRALSDTFNPFDLSAQTEPIYNFGIPSPMFQTSPSPLHRSHPNNAPPQDNSKSSASNAVRNVEDILERMANNRFGLNLSLSIPPEHVFSVRSAPRMTLEQIGLSPGDSNSIIRAQEWINSHFSAIHHNTPFLYFPQIIDIASRFLDQGLIQQPSPGNSRISDKVGNDEAALLLAVLALGSFRRETWDEQRKSYRTLHPSSPVSTTTLNDVSSNRGSEHTFGYGTGQTQSGIVPLTLFRLAQDELDELEHPSESAVQALFLLHTFVSNTSMGRRSKDFVARAVMMSHEIGLNRSIPMELDLSSNEGNQGQSKMDQTITRRRAVLYLYVYFSDVYLAALDNSPPLIKRHDYSPDIFDPILYPKSPSGLDTPSGTAPGLSAFVDLVRTSGEMLETLHGNKHRRVTQPVRSSNQEGVGRSDVSTLELVLRLDSQLDNLRDRLGTGTFDITLSIDGNVDPSTRGLTAGKLLRQIHYNWFRIALRAPFLNHPLLGHSSLSICAVSALSLLHYHRYVINAGLLNLPWMQLRRITTAIHIIFIAFWKGEITNTSASTAMDNALYLLRIMSVRWQSATKIAMLIRDLAKRSDLTLNVQQSSSGSGFGQSFDENSFNQNSLFAPVQNGSNNQATSLNNTNNTEQDLGTLFQLASNYIANRTDLGNNDSEIPPPPPPGESVGLSKDNNAQSIPVWPQMISEDSAWPQESVDFWADLIGPFG